MHQTVNLNLGLNQAVFRQCWTLMKFYVLKNLVLLEVQTVPTLFSMCSKIEIKTILTLLSRYVLNPSNPHARPRLNKPYFSTGKQLEQLKLSWFVRHYGHQLLGTRKITTQHWLTLFSILSLISKSAETANVMVTLIGMTHFHYS